MDFGNAEATRRIGVPEPANSTFTKKPADSFRSNWLALGADTRFPGQHRGFCRLAFIFSAVTPCRFWLGHLDHWPAIHHSGPLRHGSSVFCWGYLTTRFQEQFYHVMVAAALSAVFCFLCHVFGSFQSFELAFVCYTLSQMTIGGMFTLWFALLTCLLEPDTVSLGLAAVNVSSSLGAIIGPILVPVLYTPVTLYSLAVFSAACFAIFIIMSLSTRYTHYFVFRGRQHYKMEASQGSYTNLDNSIPIMSDLKAVLESGPVAPELKHTIPWRDSRDFT